MQPLLINSWADLPRGIVAAEQAGSIGLAHLLRALHGGRIAFFPILPDTSGNKFKKFARLTADRPAVVLIPDDDYQDRGPAGFPLAERIMRWAAGAMVHAAGAQLEHYDLVVATAARAKRIVIVECSSATAPAWLALARTAMPPERLLLVIPREGRHPVLPPREAAQ